MSSKLMAHEAFYGHNEVNGHLGVLNSSNFWPSQSHCISPQESYREKVIIAMYILPHSGVSLDQASFAQW